MPACPACESIALTELVDRSGVAYDCCAKCRGVWLDGGELSQLMGKPFPEALLSPKDGTRLCARCSKPMARGGFLNPALVVDRCAYCSGLWLDASELRVVRRLLGIDQATEAETAAPPTPHSPEPTPAAAAEQDASAPPVARHLAGQPLGGERPPGSAAWQFHAGWWLIIGLGTLVYGWSQYAEWKVITAAGGLAGASPAPMALAGAVMATLGLGFLLLQPEDPADLYLSFLKAAFTPRRRRYGRRGAHRWYDDNSRI